MISTIQVLILLLAVVAAVAVIANRSGIPPAILLVLTGVLLALVPGLPPVELTPELVLFLVLPPFAGVPLMLGTGIGSEIRQPLGYAIVGGLLVSQLMTLFTTPVVYIYMDRLSGWLRPKIRR